MKDLRLHFERNSNLARYNAISAWMRKWKKWLERSLTALCTKAYSLQPNQVWYCIWLFWNKITSFICLNYNDFHNHSTRTFSIATSITLSKLIIIFNRIHFERVILESSSEWIKVIHNCPDWCQFQFRFDTVYRGPLQCLFTFCPARSWAADAMPICFDSGSQ